MKNDRSVSFSASQLKELRVLGVRPEMMEQLAITIGVAYPLVNRRVKMADVRDKTLDLRKALKNAHAQVSEVLAAKLPTSATVRAILVMPSIPAGGAHSELERTLVELTASLALVTKALAKLPTSQARGNGSESAIPIGWIHRALLAGWEKAQTRARPTANSAIDPTPIAVAPEYPFPLSSHWNSPFRKVAEICLDAMRGTHEQNYERAIKNYIRRVGSEYRPSPGPPLGEIIVRFQRADSRVEES